MDILGDAVRKRIIISFIIGFISGMFAVWLWTATVAITGKKTEVPAIVTEESQQQPAQTQVETQTQQAASVGRLIQNDSIVVPDQKAGSQVIVSYVVLDTPGWVVVHEGDASHIGNALGATRFDEGEYSGVVELLRPTVAGQIYRAILYHDNGDKEFSLDTDFPFLQNGNQPVVTMFKAL